MKSDVIIIGSELDAFIASIRLQELGYSSKIISKGKGSHLYSLGSIKILGVDNNPNMISTLNPFDSIDNLSSKHPYKIIGKDKVTQSIDWFFNQDLFNKLYCFRQKNNVFTISPIGNKIPSYGLYIKQINRESLRNNDISIINFNNQKDFHSHLIAESLNNYSNSIEIINVEPPNTKQHLDNSSIANSFDKLNDIDDYFYKIKEKLNNRTSVAIFPAIVGINNYLNIIKRAEKILNKKCFEAPTLPPSIPGIRLNKLLEKEILKFNDINNSAHITNANLENNKCMYLTDNYGRKIYGKAFIFANGGILMGGLVVNSDGKIIEKILNSKVNQINPMTCNSNYKTLNALQMSGVIIDEDLKAKNENGIKFENVYFTGRNLSDWNPSLEFSSEGVSIASGWHSANTVASYLSI